MPGIQQVELTVEDNAIHCASCEQRIATVLRRLPGVIHVEANHTSQRVSLALDAEKTSLDEVKATLATAGYEAE